MEESPPEGLYSIINDFVKDILTTFPEYSSLIKKFWEIDYDDCFLNIEDEEKRKTMVVEDKKDKLLYIYNHCKRVLPERFFDILYQNADIFSETSDINTEFLPRIVFKHLWNSDITDSTRETIWKYLQLILFTVMNTIEDKSYLGTDTSKLFEAINEDELKNKLDQTLKDIQNMFFASSSSKTDNETQSKTEEDGSSGTGTGTGAESFSNENIPNLEELHNNLSGMMNGKLGKLAMEMAEEASASFNIDPSSINNSSDIFKELFKNPGKLMSMVKNIGDKLDKKIKSGEISESEMMKEGLDMLNKMKESGGMSNMSDLLSKMGMGMPGMPNMGGKNEKLNLSAMQSQMEKSIKLAKMKENMRKKKDERASSLKTQSGLQDNYKPKYTEEELISLFEKPERSARRKPLRQPVDFNSLSSSSSFETQQKDIEPTVCQIQKTDVSTSSSSKKVKSKKDKQK